MTNFLTISNSTRKMVPLVGFELTTYRLQGGLFSLFFNGTSDFHCNLVQSVSAAYSKAVGSKINQIIPAIMGKLPVLLLGIFLVVPSCQPALAEGTNPVLHPDLNITTKKTICPDHWVVVGDDCSFHTLPRRHAVKTKQDAPMKNTFPMNQGGFQDGSH